MSTLKNKYLDRMVGIVKHGGTDGEKLAALTGLMDEIDHHLQAAIASDDLDSANDYLAALDYVGGFVFAEEE